MSNCYLILDSHDNFYSYSNSCTSRIPRRGAGAVCSNGEEVQSKAPDEQDEPDEPVKWTSHQKRRSTTLLSSCRLQGAKRNTHLSNQLVV